MRLPRAIGMFALLITLRGTAAAADVAGPWSIRAGVGTVSEVTIGLEHRPGAHAAWRIEGTSLLKSDHGLGIDYSIPDWGISSSTRSRTHGWLMGLARLHWFTPAPSGRIRGYVGGALEAGRIEKRDERWTHSGSTSEYIDAHSRGPRLAAWGLLGFDAKLTGPVSLGLEVREGAQWEHLRRSSTSTSGETSSGETQLRAHLGAANRWAAALRVAL